jgi:GDP-4-dehydro-6-deoxy-D-mannose reductase
MRETPCGVGIPDGPVLLTGAAGFVGTHLMQDLGLGEGDVATDITDTFTVPRGVGRVAWRLPEPAPESLGGFRSIIHLAALSSVAGSHRNLRDVYGVNLMGVIELLCFVQSRCPGARVLLVSSSEVYMPSENPLDEGSPLQFRSPYAASKAAAEQAAAHFRREEGLDVVTARSFPHYGPGQAGNFALPSFCRRIIEARREGATTLRAGNLFPVRDYLHVKDVVRAYAILLSMGEPGEVYNVCSGSGVSMGEMLALLLKVSGASLTVTTDPVLTREGDHFKQVGNPGRLRALGGFAPSVGPGEGLADLYSWWNRRIP